MKKTNSNRQSFKKFVRSRKCLKNNGNRKSIKTAANYASHMSTVNVLLGEDKDKGVYLLKTAAQFERKINKLELEGKMPYRKSQPAIKSANQSFIKYLNEIFK